MSRAGLQGHLRLTCSANAAGQSFLREQSFRAPLHISKSYWDDDSLLVQMINPTAGLFAGDETELDVRVEAGARLTLQSPSACRVHTMADDQRAIIRQHFAVAEGGRLEFSPQILIPQTGARCWQRTRIEIEQGGEGIFFELIAPGRVASGEAFQYSALDFDLKIRFDSAVVSRERFRLAKGDASLHALTSVFPTGYYASCFAFSPRLAEKSDCWETIRALHGPRVWLGASALCAGGFAVKILACDSAVLRSTVHVIRDALRAELRGNLIRAPNRGGGQEAVK